MNPEQIHRRADRFIERQQHFVLRMMLWTFALAFLWATGLWLQRVTQRPNPNGEYTELTITNCVWYGPTNPESFILISK